MKSSGEKTGWGHRVATSAWTKEEQDRAFASCGLMVTGDQECRATEAGGAADSQGSRKDGDEGWAAAPKVEPGSGLALALASWAVL